MIKLIIVKSKLVIITRWCFNWKMKKLLTNNNGDDESELPKMVSRTQFSFHSIFEMNATPHGKVAERREKKRTKVMGPMQVGIPTMLWRNYHFILVLLSQVSILTSFKLSNFKFSRLFSLFSSGDTVFEMSLCRWVLPLSSAFQKRSVHFLSTKPHALPSSPPILFHLPSSGYGNLSFIFSIFSHLGWRFSYSDPTLLADMYTFFLVRSIFLLYTCFPLSFFSSLLFRALFDKRGSCSSSLNQSFFFVETQILSGLNFYLFIIIIITICSDSEKRRDKRDKKWKYYNYTPSLI